MGPRVKAQVIDPFGDAAQKDILKDNQLFILVNQVPPNAAVVNLVIFSFYL